MTVLVTGGAGYIGSHMVLELLDAGERVVVIDNLSTGFRWAVPQQVPLVVGCIGDQALVRDVLSAHNITAIIHFAGSVIVPESVSDPLKYYFNNTSNSRSLIAAAVSAGIAHLIFSSTAAVYGMPERSPVDEAAPLCPISPYGTSKWMTEIMLRDVSLAHGLGYVALRYFNVCGADPLGRSGQSTPRATHLIKVACEAALGKRAGIEIFGTDYETPDGTCIRDYIHVKDLCRAHLAAMKHLREGGQSNVFNCGYSRGYSVHEVLAAVKKVSSIDFDVVESPRRAGDPPVIVADNTKIRRYLNWVPEYDDLAAAVEHALAWERQLAARTDGG